MWEITVESKTRVTENKGTVVYERKYRGLEEENGRLRLLAYVSKRMPLTEAQVVELPASERIMKDAA